LTTPRVINSINVVRVRFMLEITNIR